jgi:hypothetical protein
MDDIKSILQSLGLKLSDDGPRFWRSAAVYRDGDNPTALRISKKNGGFIDFVTNTSGPLYKLVQLTLGLPKPKEAKKWLENKKFVFQPQSQDQPKVTMPEYFDPKMLDNLLRVHDYWINRGISEKILQQFQGGIATRGRMINRYVFPIFGGFNKIIGFSGRDLTNKSTIKWKIIGDKHNFVFPLHINRDKIVNKKEVILVESIGDTLSLFEAGFDHVVCLFGTYISDAIISALVGLQLKKIFICVNNDQENNNVGNKKACDIYLRLIKFFDKEKIKIKLPTKKDFGEMNAEEIKTWDSLKTLAIVGTREFNDYNRLKEVVEPYKKETGMVVSGGARGSDLLGRKWALENQIPLIEFIPKWDEQGKAAGIIRNEYIIRNADQVVAIMRPGSKGTQNDIDIATRLGIPIQIVDFNAKINFNA